jgi:hypothetical protein
MPITIESAVNEATLQEFLPVYRDAFAPLEVLAAGRQSFHDDEFLEILGDASVLKFLAWDRDESPRALSFIATDLQLIPWVSPAYFAHRFPEPYARGAVYYCGTILVRPEHQHGPWAGRVLDAMVEKVVGDHAVIAFDCCGFNVDTVRVPDIVAAAARRQCVLDAFEVDVQRYYAYAPSGVIDLTRVDGFGRVDDVIDLREPAPSARAQR